MILGACLIPMMQTSLRAQTTFSKETGKYATLLNNLKKDLYSRRERPIVLDGKERNIFIPWIRDHIHTSKAYKYWEKDMSSYVDFFLNRQTSNGMYYDYVESYKDHPVGQLFFTNVFDKQFYYVDVNQQLFFFRMPIEADLEYLLVEGVHNIWQATSDTPFVKHAFPILEKGLAYLMNDPLRWSSEKQMVKRAYSIDTWDFFSQPDTTTGLNNLLIHIGCTTDTPKGIMFGDNSGMSQAFRQLAEMGSALNNPKVEEYKLESELFKRRLNRICWNGKYYSHFIPEQPYPTYIKSDPLTALTLSNTYSMNRGVTTPEMASSIISQYKKIGQEMKGKSIAEWFGIYPFVEPQFGGYKVGTYMNGAILPLVGGELTKAAFQNGEESYAIQTLDKLETLMKLNNGELPGCISQDGTKQAEAIPDEWGQAAFVSALIEGLAGVVDKGTRFDKVEISPRWSFAGINKAEVTVGYGNDGKEIFYTYESNGNKDVYFQLNSKCKSVTLRIPIPKNDRVTTVTNNGNELPYHIEQINQSRYVSLNYQGDNISIHCHFK